MASPVAPGFYTREIDLSDYIQELSSTLFAVVGTAERGPLNTPTLIVSEEDFINTFGRPLFNAQYPNESLRSYGGHAAIAYLRRGQQLFYTRVADGSQQRSQVVLQAAKSSNYATVTGSLPGPWEIKGEQIARLTGANVGSFQITSATHKLRVKVGDSGTLTSLDLVGDGYLNIGIRSTSDVVSALQSAFDDAGLSGLTFSVTEDNRVRVESDTAGPTVTFYITDDTGADGNLASQLGLIQASTYTDGIALGSWANSSPDADATATITPIEPLSLALTESVSGETFTDDGLGVITGSSGTAGTIDYETGAISLTGAPIGLAFATISGTYRSNRFKGTAANNRLEVVIDDSGSDPEIGLNFPLGFLTPAGALAAVRNRFTNSNNNLGWIFISSTETLTDPGAASSSYTETLDNTNLVPGTLEVSITTSDATPALTLKDINGDGNLTLTSTHSALVLESATIDYTTGALSVVISGASTFTGAASSATAPNYSYYSNLTTDPNFRSGQAWLTQDNRLAIATLTTGVGGDITVSGATVDTVTYETRVLFGFSSTTVSGTDNGLVDALIVTAESPGTWANGLQIIISQGSNVAGTFRFSVVNPKTGRILESWDNVTREPGTQGYIVELTTAVQGNRPSTLITVENVEGSIINPDFGTYQLANGSNGTSNITAAEYIGITSLSGIRTGLKVYEDPDEIRPEVVAVPGVYNRAVVTELIQLCETRQDCLALVDPPSNLGPQEISDWHNGRLGGQYDPESALNSSYAALFWPWIKVFDPYNNLELFIPPSGPMASVFAYNDQQGENWTAPAGPVRGRVAGALEVEFETNQAENEFLVGSALGVRNVVNPIRDRIGTGITAWGERTLQRAYTALDAIHIRRLLIFIKRGLKDLSENRFVLEQNDSVTRQRFTSLGIGFLERIRARRGLEEFRFICDESTNPPEVRDQQRMIARVYLKPIKVAEVIEAQLVVTNSGADLDELSTQNI